MGQLYKQFSDRWLKPNGSIWLYSDPHFFDRESYEFRNLIKACSLEEMKKYEMPEESYNKAIDLIIRELDDMQIKNINSKVGKNDTIIFLGDIGDISSISKLKAGYKVLIMGNHDKGASNYRRTFDIEQKWDFEFRENIYEDPSVLKGWKLIYQDEGGRKFERVVNDSHLFDEVYEGPLMISDRIILSHEPIDPLPEYMFNIHGHVHGPNDLMENTDHSMNICAEHIDYTPVNLIKLISRGLLKDVPTIHRNYIDDRLEKLKEKN